MHSATRLWNYCYNYSQHTKCPIKEIKSNLLSCRQHKYLLISIVSFAGSFIDLHLTCRCCTRGAACTVKGTHLLAARVSTESGGALHAGTWPPSLLPSCSKMSLTSPRLQVLSPASLSGPLRRKEGKWVGEGGREGRGGCKTGYYVSWFNCKERKTRKEEERGYEITLDHLVKPSGLF